MADGFFTDWATRSQSRDFFLTTELYSSCCCFLQCGVFFFPEDFKEHFKNRRIEQGSWMLYPGICLFGVKSIFELTVFLRSRHRKEISICKGFFCSVPERECWPWNTKAFCQWRMDLHNELNSIFLALFTLGLPINLSWAPSLVPHPLTGMSGLEFIWVFLGSMIDLMEFWLKPFVVLVNHSQPVCCPPRLRCPDSVGQEDSRCLHGVSFCIQNLPGNEDFSLHP